jgi:three-Cys-motif partner protein
VVTQHCFGGPWTEEKLTRLRKYLEAYTVIFTRNPRARFFRRWYVDAFAGTGIRNPHTEDADLANQPLFGGDTDVQEFMKGSARIALDIAPPFDRYLFIERDAGFAADLDDLRAEYSDYSSRIEVANGDANDVLVRWTADTNWEADRAVVFLDPYGMQVDWRTIQALADTKAVDLWVLFPLGQGLNRLLTRGGPPPPTWDARLTTSFGTDSWKDEFYRRADQLTLFDSEERLEKTATFESMAAFVNNRLAAIFEMVAPNPLLLRN